MCCIGWVCMRLVVSSAAAHLTDVARPNQEWIFFFFCEKFSGTLKHSEGSSHNGRGSGTHTHTHTHTEFILASSGLAAMILN